MSFENLESVEEMMEYIADNTEEEIVNKQEDLGHELQILGVQTFLKLFKICDNFTDEQKSQLEHYANTYNDANNNILVRQTALASVCELFFENRVIKSVKNIVRKDDSKVFQTPCEDCQASPTHLICFKQDNRIEEHFLCDDCEEAAKEE